MTLEMSESLATLHASPEVAELIGLLGVAVYTTDAEGRITAFNDAAAEMWGRQPELGVDLWCGSWRLFYSDGTPMLHEACPMGLTLKHGRPFLGYEAIAERPDGTRFWFQPFPTPFLDEAGKVVGAVNVLVDITEGKRNEAALRSSETRLRHSEERTRLAIDAAKLGTWTYEIATNCIQLDARMREIWGSPVDEDGILLPEVIERIHPDDREPIARTIAEALDGVTTSVHELEFRVVAADGAERWLTVNGQTLFEGEGDGKHAVSFVGTGLDISDRKRAEQALRDREARYRTLFTSIDEGYCLCEMIFDAEGKPADYRFLEVNDAFGKMTGILPEAIGRTARDLVPGLEDWWVETYGNAVLTGEPARFEFGSEAMGRFFDVYAAPVDESDGALFAIVFSDITERKRVEAHMAEQTAALRASQERTARELSATQQLQAMSTQMIQEDDVDALYGQILDAAVAIMRSEFASLQMLHPERGEAGELRLLAFRGFTPESAAFWEWVRPASETACGKALVTGERFVIPDVETCDFMKDSEDLLFHRETGIRAVQTTPLVSRTGSLLGMISTHWREPHEAAEGELRMLDVLARQAADLIERRNTESELKRALAAKDEFLGLVSHELRTPITTVLGNADVLVRRGDSIDPRVRQEALRDVRDGAERLNRIIGDLLMLARADRGAMEPEPLPFARLIVAAIDEFRKESTRTIDVSIDDPSIVANGHEGVISQVVRNYLTNAERYGDGSKIEVVVERVGDEARVRVLDRGIGIDRADAERVFEPFYRADAAGAIGGIGLGLSVCKRLADAVGGRVWAQPREGGGCEFGLALRLNSDELDA